jgi:hypothetical protein
VPDFAAVTDGTAPTPSSPGQPLVLVGLVYGGRLGDEMRLLITGPDGGEVLTHSERLDRTQALLFRAAGLRAPEGGWPKGTYDGTVTLLREGQEIDRRSITTEMPGG